MTNESGDFDLVGAVEDGNVRVVGKDEVRGKCVSQEN